MARKKETVSTQKRATNALLDKISNRKAYTVSALLILLILIIFYKPFVFDRLSPAGGDVTASLGSQHQIREYSQETNERALWNPAIFCGIPTYFNHQSKAFNLDRVIKWVQPILTWRVAWFLLGAGGIFLLTRILGFAWYYSLLAAIIFLFLPHFQALILVGHNYKIRAVCAMPLVLWSFLFLTRQRNLLSLAIFALSLSLQIRTKHYQIIFYTLLFILALGIYYLITWLKQKEYRRLLKSVLLALGGIVIAVLMSAQPLFVAKEYTPYSTRGGQAVSLDESQSQSKKSSGVSFEYATRWSLHPAELMTLISPRFFGGTSQEPYTGTVYPQLRHRKIPGYWGSMPFTQSSEYVGIITVILAFAGIWFCRKNGFVLTLSLLMLFALLLGFGRHFTPLYKALFLYLPYFSKFRVPMMILILISVILILLALYGLRQLLKQRDLETYKTVAIIAGFFFLLGALFLLAPGLLSYTSARDAQFANNPQILEMLKTARMELMKTDTLRMLFLIGIFFGLYSAFYYRKIGVDVFVAALIVLFAVDMIGVSQRFLGHARLVRKAGIESRYFQETQFDKILQKDNDLFRVLVLGSDFQSNDYAYRHQLIGGYSAIKPQVVQDVIENNLMHSDARSQNAVNWKIVNMCNGKYIVSPAQLAYNGLELLDVNKNRKTFLYRNKQALPRVYFTRSVKSLPNEKEVVRFMNTAEFDPRETALVSVDWQKPTRFTQKGTARVSEHTPNRIRVQAQVDSTAFMVLADTYYPVGWRAYVDWEETPIYQVNHMLRGIVVPPGTHSILFEFKPTSYVSSRWISILSTYLMWGLLAVALIGRYKDRWRSIITRK